MDARTELDGSVLPWWEKNALDETGGVFTCFDNSGRLLSTDKFTWSQGRWAWVCAELYDDAEAGLISAVPETWADRAISTARFIRQHAVLPDFRSCFRTTADGQHLTDEEGRRSVSVFADLFAALGLGAAARITTSAEAEDWFLTAKRMVLRAEADVSSRTALTEPYPVPRSHLDLAEPMNLLHTSAELLRVNHDDDLIGVRDRALDVLIDQRVSGDRWWEFMPLDPDDEDLLISRHRTPGHLLEALWMIHHAVSQAHDRGESPEDLSADQYIGLTKRAMATGWDAEHGGVFRYVDVEGGEPRGTSGDPADRYEQLVRRTWNTKLWWVHAEAMYTLRMLSERFPEDSHIARWADLTQEWTMQTFPDRVNGEWIQVRTVSGEPLDEVVALPVKDPFHIIRSLSFLNRLSQGEAPYGRSNR